MFALIDCNNFFVSCERVFDPSLRKKPVIVLSNNDGCAIARSDEAKKLGIAMAAPYFKIRDIVRDYEVRVLSCNFTLYGDMSWRVMQVLENLVPDLDIYSIDEAFLDLRAMAMRDYTAFARMLRDTVYQATGLPISVGIGRTKTLAKLANKYAKAHRAATGDIMVLDTPAMEENTLKQTMAVDVWGIGQRLAQRFARHGHHTAWQISRIPAHWVRQHMNVVVLRTVQELAGIPCSFARLDADQKRTLAITRTFERTVQDWPALEEAVATFAARAAVKLRRHHQAAGAVLAFLKTNKHRHDHPQYGDYHIIGLPAYTAYGPHIVAAALCAARRVYRPGYRYKRAGVVLLDLKKGVAHQTSMLGAEDTARQHRVMAVMDAINARQGRGTIQLAVEGFAKTTYDQRHMTSPHYTTRWADVAGVRV